MQTDDRTRCPYCAGEGEATITWEHIFILAVIPHVSTYEVPCYDCDGLGVVCCRCRGSMSECRCTAYEPPTTKKKEK